VDKYLGDLITAQRNDTRNPDTNAITDSEFVRYNQYAQNMLFGLITKVYSWLFIESEDVSIVANQQDYTVADNISFGTRIIQVEYSFDGQEKNFVRLRPTPNRYQRVTTPGRPRFYRRLHGVVRVEPTPVTAEGTLRIHYERALDSLNIRQARVNGTPSGAVIDLTHSSFGAPSADVEALFVLGTYICLTNAAGTPLLYNGVVSSYNAGTDALTLSANVSTYLQSGYALADLADSYLTVGRFTTTHSKLPNEAEQYFIEYVNRCLHNRDSSKQWAFTDKNLTELAGMIIASYNVPDKDVKSFPVDDWDLLIPGY